MSHAGEISVMPNTKLSLDLVTELYRTNPQKLVTDFGYKQNYVNRISSAFKRYGDISLSQARGKKAKSEGGILEFLKVGELPKAKSKPRKQLIGVRTPGLPSAPLPYIIVAGDRIPTLNGGDIQYVDVIFELKSYNPESDDLQLINDITRWFMTNFNQLKSLSTRVRFGYLLWYGNRIQSKDKTTNTVRTTNLQIHRLNTQVDDHAILFDEINQMRCVMKQEYPTYVN